MTTSAIRRRYGWGAARLCIEAQPVRHQDTPPLLPNATSGAATVLIGGLAVFALLRSIEPPEEKPSEIQIVQLQDEPAPEPPPPPPEQLMQPMPEPEPEPPPPPQKKPEPVVVAKLEPPKPKPRPAPAVRKPPPMPKPEPVKVAPEPAPVWKRVALAPPPAPKPETPPPAVRRPPPVQIEPPKPLPEPTESAPAWKPVALAQKPAAPKAAAPHVTIDAVNAPSAPAELPTRTASLPPGVPAAPRTVKIPPNVKPVVAAPAAPDLESDSAASAPSLARAPVTAPVAPKVTQRLPPKGALAMPGIGNAGAREAAAAQSDSRGYERAEVTAPRAQAGPSQPNAKLRGVPLGSLAACRNDRLEDDLKQKVLAAVRNREECASAAGRYRFVETKNLNAFLMWIERAPGRAEGDRCAELSYALSCLRGGAR